MFSQQSHSWMWGRSPEQPARGLFDALTCLLCPSLSFPATGLGMNEDAWKREGVRSKEGSSGLRCCPRIHIQVVLTQGGETLAVQSSYMWSSGQTVDSGILAWTFPIFWMLRKYLTCLVPISKVKIIVVLNFLFPPVALRISLIPGTWQMCKQC